LTRIQETVPDDASQVYSSLSIKKGGKQGKTHPMTQDIDMIEAALAIPDDSEALEKKKGNKKQQDSTLMDTRNITMMEKFRPNTFNFSDMFSVSLRSLSLEFPKNSETSGSTGDQREVR
jgi:hypothetical protein